MKVKQNLHWPKSPSKTQHRTLGARQRWTTKCKRYRIERFPDDGDPAFIVLVADGGGWRVIGHNRRLKAAQKPLPDPLQGKQKEGEDRSPLKVC